MGCLFRLLFLLIAAAVVGIPATVAVMGVEPAPLLQRRAELRPAELSQAASLALRLAPAAMQPGRPATVTLSGAELNLLIESWAARVPHLAVRAGVAPIGIAVGATLPLPVPDNPLGRYLNIRALVVPSESGLEIDRLSVGRIEVPSPLIRPLLVFLLDRFGGPGQGDAIYSSIRAVRIAGRRVAITLVAPANLGAKLASGSAVPATGIPAIDTLLRRASPAERQRLVEALQQHVGSDPGAVQRALETIRQHFGGKLPPIDEATVQQFRQQFGGGLPHDPAAAEAEIRRRLADDPAARQRAIEALRQHGANLPAGR